VKGYSCRCGGAGKQLPRQRAGCKGTWPGKKCASGPCLQGSADFLGLFLECELRQRERIDFLVSGALKHLSS